VKLYFRIFFILSAYSENTRNVFKRLQRMRGKYLRVYGKYDECRVVCGTQNCLRIRGKNLCVHGEDAERFLACSPNKPRAIIVRISQ
jgi:hypothetical protein